MNLLTRKKILAFFVIFWAVFGLKFTSILDTSTIIFIPFIFFASLNRRLLLLMILIICYTIQVFSLSAITGIFDSWHLFQPIKSLIVLFGLIGALNYFKITNIKNHLSNAIFIHSIIVIIFYFVPSLQNEINSLTGFVSKSTFRVNGFTHSYGTTSLMHVIALPILLSSSEKFRNLKITIILLSCFFLARVGLYLGIIFLVYEYFKVVNLKRISVLFLSLFSFLSIITWFINSDPKDFSETTQNYFLTFRWALESFIILYDTGLVTNSSTNTLNFIILNDSVVNHLFGTGNFGRGAVHLGTDISYLLYYSYVGLFGLILLVLIHSFLLIRKEKVLIFFSAIIFITAIKEPTFLTRGLWPIYILLLYDYYERKSSITACQQ